MKTAAVVMLAFLGLSYSVARADCVYPQGPSSVPDGKSASEAQMLEAMSAFKKYDSDVNAYVACLDDETKVRLQEGGAASQLIQLKSLQAKKQNAAVDELRTRAEKFNAQVRAYKGRG